MTHKIKPFVSNKQPDSNKKLPVSSPHLSLQVMTGVLTGFDDFGRPLVAFPHNAQKIAMPASFISPLNYDDIGGSVALTFVHGNIEQPMIIGIVKESIKPENTQQKNKVLSARVQVDEEETLNFTAKNNITLQCGDASITLTQDGKILLRGKYISSCASGMQTIKGGTVQIN